MPNSTRNEQPLASWSKPDRAYPTKSALSASSSVCSLPATSRPTNNGSEHIHNPFNQILSNDYSTIRTTTATTTTTNVTLKDLCDEDKQRIANLVKELAKISEEKKSAERSLAEERQQRETEMRDILKHHEQLLTEKDALLNKLLKIQQKLVVLKRSQKQMTIAQQQTQQQQQPPLQHSVSTYNIQRPTDSDLFKQPTAFAPYSSSMAATHHVQPPQMPQPAPATQPPTQQNNVLLTTYPFKSSTPNSMSPRSISPIGISSSSSSAAAAPSVPLPMTHGQLAATVVVGGRRGDHMRKIELMKQQAELMDEQRQIRELLEKQEHILREKQTQIMMQQRLHRERLDEQLFSSATAAAAATATSAACTPSTNPANCESATCCAQLNTGILQSPPSRTPLLPPPPQRARTTSNSTCDSEDTVTTSAHLDDILAHLVYKKLHMNKPKARTPNRQVAKLTSTNTGRQSNTNHAQTETDQDDHHLVDLIIEQSRHDMSASSSSSLLLASSSRKTKLNHHHHQQQQQQQQQQQRQQQNSVGINDAITPPPPESADDAANKLIEDLFFLK